MQVLAGGHNSRFLRIPIFWNPDSGFRFPESGSSDSRIRNPDSRALIEYSWPRFEESSIWSVYNIIYNYMYTYMICIYI